jgi:hypothetical protein
MTRDTTRIDDGINPAHLDSPTNHTPEGINIDECQAEHDRK